MRSGACVHLLTLVAVLRNQVTIIYEYSAMSSLSVTPPLALAAAIVLPSLCGIAVGLRFYIRRAQRLDFRLDDWLTVPPLVYFPFLFCLLKQGLMNCKIDTGCWNGDRYNCWSASLIKMVSWTLFICIRRCCQGLCLPHAIPNRRVRRICVFQSCSHGDGKGSMH